MSFVQQRGSLLRRITGFRTPEAVMIIVTAMSTLSYVVALQLTTVVNVMTVYAASPFIAGGIAFVWVGGRVTYRFVTAGTVALAGVA